MELSGRAVTVFCGASDGSSPRYVEAARALGTLLAREGVTVVYGGASVGTMGALADAALAAGGRVVGVMPEGLVKREIAHRGLTEQHVVTSMHERKALMASLCQGFITLPGGFGTWEETLEIVTWKQIGEHVKPVILLDLDGYYRPMREMIEVAIREGFMRPHFREYLVAVDSPAAAVDALRAYEPPSQPIDKWR